MPKAQQKTKVEIQRDIINALVARTGLVDVGAASTLAHLIGAVSTDISEVYYQFTRLADLFDFQRAATDDLDERAKEILGATVQRIGARRAIGTLEFTRAAAGGVVAIPAGTAAKNVDGVSVETIEAAQIDAGQTTTSLSAGGNPEARAAEPGIAGNIAATSAGVPLAFASRPAGVTTVFNPVSFVGGQAQESDDAFRQRINNIIRSLPRSTVDALAFIVLGIEDPLGTGKVIRYSHVAEDINQPGVATLYVDDGNNTTIASAAVNVVQNDTGLASVSALVGVSQTLTLALAGFTADMIGNQIRVYGAATLDNNGIFLITGQTATTLTYTNPNAGAGAEAAGTLNFVAGENMCASLGGPPPDTATGGEEFLYLQNKPVVGTALALTQVTSGGAATALVRGVPPVGQYSVRESNGLIKFDPALAIGDTVFADYEYYTGLISAAQKVVDGDPNDRLNYPGYRAAGIDVQVKAPTQRVIAVTGVLTITRGFERTVVRAAAEANVVTYVNGLGISGDVIRSEIIEQIMATPGVYNVTLSAPTRGVTVINDDQVARTDTTQVALT